MEKNSANNSLLTNTHDTMSNVNSNSNICNKCSISIGMLNINGLNDNKIGDDNFKETLDAHDIVIFVEIRLTSDLQIDDLYCYSKFRPKISIRGRNSGGISIITKQNIRKGIQIVDTSTDLFIWFKLDKLFFELNEDIYVCATYFSPDGSAIYSKNGKSPFEHLEEKVTHFGQYGEVILIGDFNARSDLDDFIKMTI